MTRFLAFTLLLLLVVVEPAGAQGPGLFIRTDCTTLTAPVIGQTWCFDATTRNLKVWNGSTYAITLATFTSGSIIFAGATGELTQDNANLFWDNTNKRVGIGTATPDIAGYGFNPTVTLRGTNRGVLELVTGAADAAGNTAGSLVFTAQNNTAVGADKKIALIQANTRGTNANNRGGDLTFSTKLPGGVLQQTFTIKETGSVLFDRVGPHAIGGDSQEDVQLYIAGNFTTATGAVFSSAEGIRFVTNVTVPATFPGRGFVVNPTLLKASSGTHSLFAGLYVGALAITAGAATLTDAASVYVAGPPTVATTNYALWVDSGTTRLDGLVTLGDTTVLTSAGVGDIILPNNTGDVRFVNAAGTDTVLALGLSSTNVIRMNFSTQTTIGANGAASALTANPVGYIILDLNGTERIIPFYSK